MWAETHGISLENHPTRLSVRWVTKGEYSYCVGGDRFSLVPGTMLVLDDGRTYDSWSRPGVGTSLFSLSFSRRLTAEVLDAHSRTDSDLVDDPETRIHPEGLEFLTGNRPVENAFRSLLGIFVEMTRQRNLALPDFQELIRATLSELVFAEKKSRREMNRLPSLKASTRIEIHRRLNRARAMIHAGLDQELSLELLAREACLSSFHFLRLFKQAFGKTPYQYSLDLRLEKARRLLDTRKAPLLLVALECGFQDPSTFTKAFKRKFGVLPSRVISNPNSKN